MGKVERFNAYSFAGFAEKVMTYNIPFITYVEGVLSIGSALKLDYSPYQTRVWNGETLLISTALNWGVTGTCYVAYGDTLFYAQFNDPGGRRIVVFYEIIDNEEYWAARGSSGNGTMDYKMLSELYLYRVSDGTRYQHPGRLNYNIPEGYVDIVRDAIFLNTGNIDMHTDINTKAYEDPNLWASTTVPTNKIIHLNDKDYFSMSNNHLFLIETE